MAVARWMYGASTAPAQTDEALAAFGLYREGPLPEGEKAPEVWPCNIKTVRLFDALRTQWRMSMAGPSGLDYSAAWTVAKVVGIKLTKQRLGGLQVMESAALSVMAERRD